jgi:hypothetical protein
MVKVYYKGRHVCDEPPYTEEEEMALYKAASARGGLTILHGSPGAASQPLPKVPPPPAGKPPRS